MVFASKKERITEKKGDRFRELMKINNVSINKLTLNLFFKNPI